MELYVSKGNAKPATKFQRVLTIGFVHPKNTRMHSGDNPYGCSVCCRTFCESKYKFCESI